ncbi:arginine N-methyltransferase, type I [Trypanosoma grayi]|uniref:arginine N-methyltransferase, type I n=1 Tax=Trypanosoma grayi TaxID=71804 RepID=UPI0004F3F8F0|nr:arginine N-methyltransferase, type I [Trypanosoma grayi]KEG10748.1 arginine N-methyltransferase, type I [Trypanosoma grayi]
MASRHFAEDYDSGESLQEQYFDGYADLGVHRVMLADEPRMSFYRHVMTCDAVVRGRVVVDVGSGTGILSMWAARAGARHVFSIEASPLRHVQAEVLADNGLSESVTLLPDTVENVVGRGAASFVAQHGAVLQGCGVSVVVSEWMGFYLLHEGMLSSVVRARDFFNEVNVLLGISRPVEMVPDRATIHVAPMSCHPYYEERYRRFWGSVDGVDLSRYGAMEYETHLESAAPLIDTVPPACLLHEGALLAELDLAAVSADAVASLCKTVHFDFPTSAVFSERFTAVDPPRVVVDGFTLWFDVSFRDAVLSTSPRCPPTHWKQTTILLPASVRAEELVEFTSTDVTLDVEVRLVATDDLQRCYTIELELK